MIIKEIDGPDGSSVAFEVSFQPHSELDKSNMEQFEVLMEALRIYEDRNRKYKDNWRRQGWRSCLFDLRRKVERVWDVFWSATPRAKAPDAFDPDLDDALDVINFAALVTRSVREGDRDGAWSW